jgi:hypothetical protein
LITRPPRRSAFESARIHILASSKQGGNSAIFSADDARWVKGGVALVPALAAGAALEPSKPLAEVINPR